MNYLDICILCLMALFVFNGVRKGFIISLASLIALVLGIYAAIHFSGFLDGILMEYINPSGNWLPVISFIVMFLLVVIGVMILGKALEKLVDLVGMSLLNHLAGGLLGIIKGFLIISILLYIFAMADPHDRFLKKEIKEKSLFYASVQPMFPRLMKIFS